MHIFIDESGDLGHKNLYLPGRSPFFVVSGICTPNPHSIAKCVVKTRASLQGRDIEELKFTDSKPATRRRMNKLDIEEKHRPILKNSDAA